MRRYRSKTPAKSRPVPLQIQNAGFELLSGAGFRYAVNRGIWQLTTPPSGMDAPHIHTPAHNKHFTCAQHR